MPPQRSQGVRGIAAPYLSIMSDSIKQFHACLQSDAIMQALNILRFMDALAFPVDKEEQLKHFDTVTYPGIMKIENTALLGDGYPDTLKAEAIRKEKALLLEHLEVIMLKLHARDAWLHETYLIEGGPSVG